VSRLKEKSAWPLDKKVAFAIRDDDVSYFTQPWMLDLLYKNAWRLGFKVSLAVIPNLKATHYPYIPFSHRGTNISFPISENTELIDYLRKKIAMGYIDIIQHGYNHSHEDRKPEFAIDDFKLVDEKLRKGNRLLRKTFKRDINVFAAPHERISREGWKSLDRNKMCLCRRFTLGRFLLTAPFSSTNLRRLAQATVHHPNPFKLMTESVIDFTDVPVIQWDLILDPYKECNAQLDEAKKAFLTRLKQGGTFVMLHHHWEYFYENKSKSMRQNLLTCFNEFLEFVASTDAVWKTTLSELCLWVKSRYL